MFGRAQRCGIRPGYSFEKGQQQPEGCIHQFRASLVFTAFALEAYLNHIGPKLFPDWSKLERLGPRNKLKKVAEHLALKVDGNRPWQVMEDLFGYRNDIAHGRSAQQTSTETVPFDEYQTESPSFSLSQRSGKNTALKKTPSEHVRTLKPLLMRSMKQPTSRMNCFPSFTAYSLLCRGLSRSEA